ncbi:PAS domain S-box protein [Microcoleus sp. FACHB-831]|uniref:sensor domain-containing protein n=1 Tax=Microcoleus sp. FACHB-831 TaxID=2692827 RepID=UPI00168A1F5C|nr:PAS domain S-box protein [Microcoleus sp. FACHB-831]MBD1923983.1 PAS domain S-box protein [Microcoleus sp. FACHB-831]
MSVNEFAQNIEIVRVGAVPPCPPQHFSADRVAVLHQTADDLPIHQQKFLAIYEEELRVALEKLLTANEQLCQQNQQLLERTKALEENLTQYQDLFEFAPDAYLVTDAEGTIQQANRATARLFKVSQHFLVGKPLLSFVPEEERQTFNSHLNWMCRIDQVHEWELRLRQPEEGYFDAAVTVAATCEREDKAIALRWLLRDITERKRTEAIKTKVQVLESMVEGVNVSDENGIIFLTNPAFDAMFGYSQGELLGERVSVLNAHQNSRLIGEITSLLQAGGSWSGEIENRKKDGTPFITYGRISTLEISGKKYWVSVYEDITSRKLVEEALRESQRRLATLIDSLPGIAFSSSNDPEWSMRYLSEGCLNLTGYRSEELLENGVVSYNSILYPEDLSKVAIAINEAVANKQPYVVEYRIRTKSGGERWLWEKGRAVFDSNGRVLGREGFITDITEIKHAEQALREKEEFLQLILDNIPQFIFWKDKNSVYLGCNTNFARAAGLNSPEEIVGKTDYELAWKKEESDFFRECDARVMDTDTPEYHIIEPQFQADGKQAWVDTNKIPLHDSLGNVVGILGSYEDITERKHAEEALRQAEQKYHSIFENAVEGIFQTTVDGYFLTANPMLARIYGYDSPEELIASVTDIQHQLYVDRNRRDEFKRLVHEQGALWGFESQVYRKDGSLIWISENGHAIYDASDRLIGYEGAVEDITSRKAAEAMIQYQAFHDLLTGLPNRTLFNERVFTALTSARSSNSSLAVMFLDLDRFKIINDTLGHAIGDQLLQGVSERLKYCLREGDTFARWGGDEFTLLLPQINDAEDAAKIAQRILEALKPAFNLEGHELYISSSIGIALYPQDGGDVQTLLRNADAALYRAKEHGRNNYRFYLPSMNSQASELLALENQLHQALEREEFVVYYQPQVNVKTGEITGMEALVRWQHPELGLVAPGTFIPLAEANGLIVPIGEWVLRTACAQNKAWQDAGFPPVRVAVNLSARQFQQPTLVAMVGQVLAETGLEARFLELEITETTIMQNVEFARTMLSDLQAMGVHISMDDFGTGYSSLSYLKKFPFHTIKIDQSFIRELTSAPQDTAIISAVNTLGYGLNLRVVAEGVETHEQLQLLRSLQCDEMQGYLFSRSLSVVDATKVLQKYWLQASLIALNEENQERLGNAAALDLMFLLQPSKA